MKKTCCLLLIALLLLSSMAGCGAQKMKLGHAKNEILTYERIDPEKTHLIVSRTGNVYLNSLIDAFEEANPDVQVISLDITGGNDVVVPVRDWVTRGVTPDIMFTMLGVFTPEQTEMYFENLSTNRNISSYQAEALSRVAVNANAYWLPGASRVNAMHYNKTLFEQYGWEVPKTFDEFVALCVRITEDTDGTIQPWNPNAKYSNEFLKVTEAFVYEEVFAGVENRAWYEDFCSGKATFTGHMEPYYEMIRTLVDNDLLREEHFSYSATTRGEEFTDGKIAMCNGVTSTFKSDKYTFGYFPFPTTKGKDGYVCDEISVLVGVPKKERTEAERDAVERFIDFFSSEEGQKAYIDKQLMISNIKGVSLNAGGELALLEETISKGRHFALIDFASETGATNFSLSTGALQMVLAEKTGEQCIADVDKAPYVANEARETSEILGTAATDFTILETSNFIADMYRAKADAQIGLIANNIAYRGNLMRIFAGGLTKDHVTVLKPRSFGNGSKLMRASMTGQQLMDTLNHPAGNDAVEDCIYAFSGLKCKVAPWEPLGERYLSVALEDGTPIDPNAVYTVAFWEGTVANEYITGDTVRFEGTWEELMTSLLEEVGTIAPAVDGRITLEWD